MHINGLIKITLMFYGALFAILMLNRPGDTIGLVILLVSVLVTGAVFIFRNWPFGKKISESTENTQ